MWVSKLQTISTSDMCFITGLYIVKKAVKRIFKSGGYEHEFVLVRRENQPCAPWKEEYSVSSLHLMKKKKT